MILDNQSTEGATAKAIEEQTSKLPSDLFLYASLAAMGTSLTLNVWVKVIMPYLLGNGLLRFYCWEFITSL